VGRTWGGASWLSCVEQSSQTNAPASSRAWERRRWQSFRAGGRLITLRAGNRRVAACGMRAGARGPVGAQWHANCILGYNRRMLTVARLTSGLPIRGLGHPLDFHRVLASTNDRAAELAREGTPEGALVVAEEQSAGRGRTGKGWMTAPASALAMSLVLRPQRLAPPSGWGPERSGRLGEASGIPGTPGLRVRP
jgi:hypothetical protein